MVSISVSELRSATPQKWRDAAADVLQAAKRCKQMADYARDEVVLTLRKCWAGEAGQSARSRFVKHADDYEAAGRTLQGLVRTYEDLAHSTEAAQNELHSALSYAQKHNLTVEASGRVQLDYSIATAPGDNSHLEPVTHAQGIIDDALRKATEADAEAAGELRTIEALTRITDPKLVRDALMENSPFGLALRLSGDRDGLHPINVPREQIEALNRASRETGISRKLLLSILWQEQQWYQNHEPDLNGPVSWAGRTFNWLLEETIKPDKSLGITHMKLETAREVISANSEAFTSEDGTYLGDLNDNELTQHIVENPNANIRLTAYYLQDLQENPHGSDTDKQLFVLYAADTPQVREWNEEYGDEADPRKYSIGSRSENWDKIEPHIEDAMRWDALSEQQRTEAIRKLESQAPEGYHISVEPIYQTGGTTTGVGSGTPSPHTPVTTPAPAPTPPARPSD